MGSEFSTHIPGLLESAFWHPYTAIPHYGPREMIVRAQGAYLCDSKGHRLFDATSSWWCQLHGHCHPRLVEALREQAGILDQVLVAPHSHPVAQTFSEELIQAFGRDYSKVFFSDNGSTSVEVALKMALQYFQVTGKPRKNGFMALDLGYHGDTLGAMAVGAVEEFQKHYPKLMERTIHVPTPYTDRCPAGEDPASFEMACAEIAIRRLEENHEHLAAFIVEPLVLGAGGVVTYSAEYLNRVVRRARELDVLVIFDEVFTGFGRTGTMFAWQQLAEIPDMVCLSKGLTSGMLPLGATVVRQGVFEAFHGGDDRRFSHGHTFTANALSCRVALESLRMFADENVLERNRTITDFFASNVDRFRDLPHVGDARQLGMIWTLELVKEKSSKEMYQPSNKPGWEIATRLWEKGFWLRPLRQALYVIPPYCSTLEDLSSCLDAIAFELKKF